MVSFSDVVTSLIRSSEVVFFMQLIVIGAIVWVAVRVGDAYNRLGRYVNRVEAIFTVLFTDAGRKQIEEAHAALKGFEETLKQLQDAQKIAQRIGPQIKSEEPPL